ncbi:hypothetical protein LC605_15085 [Nostoc sp. CHAB 5836]|uniref:hypothetical protein n=1 Tax=Nostoc sp. CHAB 5836 TaxID=2780404 RepID=UPI001E32153C|nr:hypothetical protein [Nostoc sp. CHAB 5836]MCC5616370.1 hypothetical protein [Nostoc sp. CHAB 5836]
MDVLEQLQQLSDYDEIQQLNENYLGFVTLVHSALEAEADGQVDSGDVDATIGQAIEDHAQNQLDIFDIEVEVEFEPEITSAAGADFGDALSEIIDNNFDDAAEGIAAISEVADITPEEVQAYLMGQAAPVPEVTEALADHFLSDDEMAYQQFMLLGQAAYQEAMPDDEPVEMSADVQNLRAEFNSIQTEREVGFRLRQLEKIADQLEDKNILTPAERNSLLRSANFSQDVDSVAVFCQFCTNSGVNPNTYLDNVEFCLNWKAQSGPSNYSAFFSQEVEEVIDVNAHEKEESFEFVTDYRSRHGYQ